MLICISAFFINIAAYAQVWELGGGVGISSYKGEIVKNVNPLFFKPSSTLIVKQNISHSFTLKYTISHARLFANDKYSNNPFNKQRNAAFASKIWEFAFIPEYNFLDYREKNYRNMQRWSPYFYGGIAVFSFESNLKASVANPEKMRGEGYGISIPMGIGIKYAIDHHWNIGFEAGGRKTFTDQIDLISDMDLTTGYQRGDPTKKDWYYISTFFVTYTFWGVRCPDSMKDLQ